MCGIVGYIGKKNQGSFLIDGLKLLEYRGYDSAGVATLDTERGIEVCKAAGKISDLCAKPLELLSRGLSGIAHTRWATHGPPTQLNAHPHQSGRIALVHNGIFENYLSYRNDQKALGWEPHSDTDTEVLAKLLEENTRSFGGDILRAMASLHDQVKGTFALGVLSQDHPESIFLTKRGSPLVLGKNENGVFFASDTLPLNTIVSEVTYLEDGDIVEIHADKISVFNVSLEQVSRPTSSLELAQASATKQGYPHFMIKEIFEQASVVRGSLASEAEKVRPAFEAKHITVLGCGTAYYAGLVAKYFLEEQLRIPVSVELASEFHYRQPALMGSDELVLAITQSGETIDTLTAVKHAKEQGAQVVSICNVLNASIPRAADYNFHMNIGPEIGVASTKAFTAMLLNLYFLAQRFVGGRTLLPARDVQKLAVDLEETLAYEPVIQTIAKEYFEFANMLFIGRGYSYPIALEGALKLKEISYIHAEAYASGELKHGPIALVEPSTPTVAIVPRDSNYLKTLSNITEVKARSGRVIAVGDPNDKLLLSSVDAILPCAQNSSPLFQAILSTVPLQLFAYHVARLRGTDIDQPRNLAKSVTVE